MLRGVLTWWSLAGLVAWFLTSAAGRPAQVSVVVVGWAAGTHHVWSRRHPGRPVATTAPCPPAPDLHPTSGTAPPAPAGPDPERVRELKERAAALRALVDPGVEVVILLAHQAELIARETSLGLDLVLDAHRASYVLRSGAGDVVRTNTGGQQTLSVLVPARLLDGPDGPQFLAAVMAWGAAGALVDVEWEVEIDGTILYVQVRHDDASVQLGSVS
jgi:hypothetical protein